MKIQLALIFLFFYIFSFSQNKKKQIEYLNLKLDSLNYVIEQERSIFRDQIDVMSQNLIKANKRSTKKITELTEELGETKSQLEDLKNDQKIKQQQISKQKNQIQKLNDSISKLNIIINDSKMSEIDFPDFLLDKSWASSCSDDGSEETRITFENQLIEKEYEGEVEVVNVSFYEGGGEVLRIESNNSKTRFLIFYLSYPESGEELLLLEFKLIDGKLISGEGEYQLELILCD